MDEKWRLSLWAAAAAKDMEFAATQRSSILPRAKCLAGEAQLRLRRFSFCRRKAETHKMGLDKRTSMLYINNS